jgi:hypothetical protein
MTTCFSCEDKLAGEAVDLFCPNGCTVSGKNCVAATQFPPETTRLLSKWLHSFGQKLRSCNAVSSRNCAAHAVSPPNCETFVLHLLAVPAPHRPHRLPDVCFPFASSHVFSPAPRELRAHLARWPPHRIVHPPHWPPHRAVYIPIHLQSCQRTRDHLRLLQSPLLRSWCRRLSALTATARSATRRFAAPQTYAGTTSGTATCGPLIVTCAENPSRAGRT